MNIKTPENVVAATGKAIRNGKMGYCPNYGIAKLREMLAAFKQWAEMDA